MNGNDRSPNQKSVGYNRVSSTSLVQVLCQSPRCSVGIVRLNRSTRPRRITVGIPQKVTVPSDNGNHDGIVDESTQNSSVDLSQEHDTRWDLQVFTLLQIVAELDGIPDDVVRPCGEVHVPNRTFGKHETGDQLREVVGRDTVPVSGVDQATEWCDETADQEGNDVGPNGECDVLLDDDDESKDETEDEDSDVPVPWCLLVVLGHVLMMTISISTGPGTHDSILDITTPEESDVGNQGSDSSIGHEHCVGERSSQSRNAIRRKGLLVENTIDKDLCSWVCLSLLSKETSRHEWKRFRSKGIAVVD